MWRIRFEDRRYRSIKGRLPIFLVGAILLVAVIYVFYSAYQASGKATRLATSPNVVHMTRDAELASAVLKAKHTLDKFIERYQKPQTGDKAFGVQAVFYTDKGPERMWVQLTGYSSGKFKGKLTDEPVLLGKHKGDSVEVNRESITDWIYIHDGKKVGGGTIDVLNKRPTQ